MEEPLKRGAVVVFSRSLGINPHPSQLSLMKPPSNTLDSVIVKQTRCVSRHLPETPFMGHNIAAAGFMP